MTPAGPKSPTSPAARGEVKSVGRSRIVSRKDSLQNSPQLPWTPILDKHILKSLIGSF
jgi:hypothetical protein